MRTLGTVTLLAAHSESPLHLAWRHTGEFWTELAGVIVHHPVAILVCAAVPAVERGFAHLHPGMIDRGRLALLEMLITLWRVLLVIVAVWAATSGIEWQQLRNQSGAMAAWQIALSQVGAHLAHHIRMVLWELLFLVVALLVAYWIFVWCVRALSGSISWLRPVRHRQAALSIGRNLVFAPVLVIYLVEMARPVFQ